MKGNLKISAIAAAVAVFAMGTASAQSVPDVNTSVDTDISIWGDIEALGEVEVGGLLNVGGDINLDYDYDYNDSFTRNRNVDENSTSNSNSNVTENSISNSNSNSNVTENSTTNYNEDVTLTGNLTEDVSLSMAMDVTESHNVETDQRATDIQYNEYGRIDVRGERDVHGVSVNIDKSLSLDSDIAFSGEPTLSGDIEIDSAAIALIDNRQSSTSNAGFNDLVTNDAAIDGDAGSEASGNLQFNIAAGDNNVQDNAAALSAADASFAFGLADAEIFVNQYGAANATSNIGVTNSAAMAGNAFSDAAGNIGVNIASGNNNQQKNALAASVATSAYAQSSVSSNQISTGNVTSNEGYVEEMTDSVEVALSGTISGSVSSEGTGSYEGGASGTYEGSGNSYQSSNFYADMWEGEAHPVGPVIGHADFDNEGQGAVQNPYRDGIGGLGFDNDESGTYEGGQSGDLAFSEMGVADLEASMAGLVTFTQWIVVDHTNTASLSDSAFARASGNIGVNLAAGTGNLQANSLAMAVAQPSTNGGGENGTPPGGE